MADPAPDEGAVDPDSRERRWANLSILRLAVLLASTLFLGLSWSLASAPASSPDDDFHLASIWCAWGTEASECQVQVTPEGRAHLTVFVAPLSQHISDCMAFLPEVSGSCILQRAGGPGAEVAPGAWPARANNGAYPTGYYAVQRLLVGGSVPGSLILMRMASFVVCLATLIGSAGFLREADRWRLLLSWLVVSVPLGLFLYASTNPSGVAVASAGAAFTAMFAALIAPRRRTAWGATLLTCVLIVVGCQTRPDALYYSAIAVLAAYLASEAWGRGRRGHALLVGLPVAATLAIMALLRDSGPLGAVTGGPTTAGPAILDNLLRVPLLYIGDFATNLGWLDTHMPKAVWGSAALAILGLLLVGFRGMGVGRWAALVTLLLSGVAIPLFMLNQVGAMVGNEVQPRYLLPLVMIFAGVLAVRPGSAAVTSSRLPWLAIASLATVANSLAIHATMRRNLTGTDVVAWNLDSAREWWWDIPISPMAVWVMGSLAFAILAFVLVGQFAPSHGSASRPGARTQLATMP